MDSQESSFLGTKNVDSTVDTSRPFRSVKEAVAIFGERILAGDLYTTKTLIITNTNHSPQPLPTSPPVTPPVTTSTTTTLSVVSPKRVSVSTSLKKLESELEITKRELKLLQERESETEIALASLNAELHKNISKIAEAEGAAAGASSSRALVVFEGRKNHDDEIWEEKDDTVVENLDRTTSKSLAHMLSSYDEEGYFGYNYMKKQKKMMKKKPIIPLFGNVFSWKKGSSRKSLD
ncbi:hypothetical protein ACHQM5_022638 [Ranunculus cassubicifolius]